MSIEEMWDKLIELGVSEQTLKIISDISGYNTTTMTDVLYAFNGYRSFDQMESE